MKNRTPVFLAAGAAASALLLSGCVVAPAPAPYYPAASPAYSAPGYAYAPDSMVYAPSAPPAPYMEVQPAIPFAGAIWIGGYWNWAGGRYAWVPGRYARPRPGYSWEPRRWSASPRGGWQLGGGWRRR